MKSTAAAFLSLVTGAILGYFAYSYLGTSSGRDLWPVFLIGAFPMFICGLVVGAFWITTLRSAAAGVLGYALVVAGFVVDFSGGLVFLTLFGYWFLGALFATVVPWLIGVLLGRYALRPRTDLA